MAVETPKNPLCFVLMPFGVKKDALGRPTNFDAVYRQVIAPAVAKAGLDPMSGAPSDVSPEQLDELGIAVVVEAEPS